MMPTQIGILKAKIEMEGKSSPSRFERPTSDNASLDRRKSTCKPFAPRVPTSHSEKTFLVQKVESGAWFGR